MPPLKGKAMDLVAYVGSFFLGGVSALLILGLLFRFLRHPRKRVRDDQFLQEIADALLCGAEVGQPAGRPEVAGAATAGTLGRGNEKGFSPGHPVAAPRGGLAYTPVSELH
jgi:hypothetical protein